MLSLNWKCAWEHPVRADQWRVCSSILTDAINVIASLEQPESSDSSLSEHAFIVVIVWGVPITRHAQLRRIAKGEQDTKRASRSCCAATLPSFTCKGDNIATQNSRPKCGDCFASENIYSWRISNCNKCTKQMVSSSKRHMMSKCPNVPTSPIMHELISRLKLLHQVSSNRPHTCSFAIDIHRYCEQQETKLHAANCEKHSLRAIVV